MLKVGTVKIDVTPPVGCYLQGHLARNKPSLKVHDPLFLKILTIFDGSKRAAVITSDLLGFSEEFVSDFEKKLEKERLEIDFYILSASHTHTGPFMFMKNLWVKDEAWKVLPDYLSLLQKKIIGGIKEAVLKEEFVEEVKFGKSKLDIGIINRRRKREDGLVEMAPNPEGICDYELSVISFLKDKKVCAIFFNYSCHPTTLSTDIYEISADYPGVAQKVVEDFYGCISFFTNGACGDVRPAIIENGKFKGGTFEDIERMGRILGCEVIKIVESSKKIEVEKIDYRKEKINLPFDENYLFKNIDELKTKYKNFKTYSPERFNFWKQYWIENLKNKIEVPNFLPFEISILKIGDIKIIGLNGEIVAEYAIKIKEKIENAIIVGYSGVDIGYIPTKKIIEEGGYEGEVFLLYGYPAPFSKEIEDIILNFIFSSVK